MTRQHTFPAGLVFNEDLSGVKNSPAFLRTAKNNNCFIYCIPDFFIAELSYIKNLAKVLHPLQSMKGEHQQVTIRLQLVAEDMIYAAVGKIWPARRFYPAQGRTPPSPSVWGSLGCSACGRPIAPRHRGATWGRAQPDLSLHMALGQARSCSP